MVTRTDMTIDYRFSPRIILIDPPSTTLSVQDLVDTVRDLEDELAIAITEPKIINAAGKEDLGGGSEVGITAELQNAQVAFAARLNASASGTVTTGSTTQLIDSSADFVASGVVRGDIVVNLTDGSIADVLQVNNSTTLTLWTALTQGIENDFDVGELYKIWQCVRVSITGGNLTAVDANDIAIDPVLCTGFTSMDRALSTSASSRPGSGLDSAESTQLTEIHQIHGLEDGSDVTITDTSRSVAGLSQTIDDVGATTTVSRD